MNEFFISVKEGIVRTAEGIAVFARANKRVLIGGFTVLGLLLIVWARLGFTFEIGRFFAVQDSRIDDGSGGSGSSGGGGGGCVLSGTTCNGNVVWNHYINCGTSSAGEDCSATGKTCATNNGSPSVIGATCTGAGGSGGSSGGTGGTTPTDSSGACVFKTNFNAPEGAWFCKSLQCQLDGNPSGGKENPPKGPASSLNISVYNRSVEAPNGSGPIFVRYILDSTPKCSSGGECYPPKDPLWTCTRPDGKEVDQGRDGHDFYDCYKPIVRIYDYVPVTCCANTGLSGDCITLKEGPTGGTTPAPTSAPTGTPLPSVNPVACAPLTQTVAANVPASLQASGGTGTFQWISEGQSKTGATTTFTFASVGTKIVTVTSGGATASCLVTVGAASVTPTPVAADLLLNVTGQNASTGGAESTSVQAVGGNQVEFIMRLRNPSTTNGLQNVIVRAALPGGLTYVAGSTNIGGIGTSVDTITTAGLTIGAIGPNQESVVRFRAAVNGAAFPAGTSQAIVSTSAQADGIPVRSGQVTVLVTRQALGTEQTGPGDAALVALLVSGIATLLYVSYTNSSAFRRGELEKIGKGRDPLDFK